ncbi:MAG: 30S ribosomal protein S11 [Patescibacteria group bacterium]
MGQKKLVTKTETSNEGVAQAPVSVSKKTAKKQVLNGVAYITVSYNNTMVAISDTKGEVLAWASAGSLGFKGTKKSTPYAANLVAKTAVEKAKKYNVMNLRIIVKGIGPGRESAIRGLAGSGLTVTSITDKTPIAHNGVKSPKPRRV